MPAHDLALAARVIRRLARETRRGALRQELSRLAQACVERGGSRMPGQGLRLATRAAAGTAALGLAPAALALVPHLLPELSAAAARDTAATIHALDLQNRLLRRLLRRNPRGLEWLAARVDSPAGSPHTLEGPAIVVSWHIGATLAIAGWLLRSASRALVLRHAEDYHEQGGRLEVESVGDDPERAALALKRAADRLRDGGVVVLALDGAGAPTEPIPCLGRLVRFRRGAFVLARLTGAPLVPVVARWANAGRDRFRVDVRRPLATDAAACDSRASLEAALARAAAHELEGLIREDPGLLSIEALVTFAHSPCVEADPAAAIAATRSLRRPY